MIDSLNKLKKINQYKMLELGKSMNIYNIEISKNITQEHHLNEQLKNDFIKLDNKDFFINYSLNSYANNALIENLQALKASNEFLYLKKKNLQKKINSINQEKEKYDYLLNIEIKILKKQKLKKQNRNIEEFVYAKFSNSSTNLKTNIKIAN
jgi:hypothetical protein